MCAHDFGILPQVDSQRDYGDRYEPQRYECIKVEDDLLLEVAERLQEKLETYWHTMSRPAHGLAWYGVTLIPPRSLLPMVRILKENGNPEFYPLTQLLERAAAEGKTVIHYGI